MAQHGVNLGGDRGAVLGADIAPPPEIIGGGGVCRPRGIIDRGEDVDGGGDAGPRGHL